MSVGQGLETAFCQLVAERFGVPMEQVRYEGRATPICLPGGKGNGGSGALCIGGVGGRPGGGQGDRQGEAGRRRTAGGRGGRRRRSMPAASPSPAPTVRSVSPRSPRAHDPPYPPGEEGGLVESGEFTADRRHLPERHAYLRGGDRSRHRRHRSRALQRGGGTRPRAQSDARRRARSTAAWSRASARRWASRSCTTRTPARC